jgi:hypothetical protein
MATLRKVADAAKKHLLEDNKDAIKESKSHSKLVKKINAAEKSLPKKSVRGKK